MGEHVPAQLRRLVRHCAEFLCEYCLLHEDDGYVGFQVDHIISEKHGGATAAENLALACACCNRAKGSDVAVVDQRTGSAVRLFNPRTDVWQDHRRLVGARIEWRPLIGEATVQLLKMNGEARVLEREELRRHRKYPRAAALKKMLDS